MRLLMRDMTLRLSRGISTKGALAMTRRYTLISIVAHAR
jgi:hypothetical protein